MNQLLFCSEGTKISAEIAQSFLEAAHDLKLSKVREMINTFGAQILRSYGTVIECSIAQFKPYDQASAFHSNAIKADITDLTHLSSPSTTEIINICMSSDRYILSSKKAAAEKTEREKMTIRANFACVRGNPLGLAVAEKYFKDEEYEKREKDLLQILDLFLKTGCDIDAPLFIFKAENHSFPLHEVLKRNKIDVAEKLVRSGANLTLRDAQRRLPEECVSDLEIRKKVKQIFSTVANDKATACKLGQALCENNDNEVEKLLTNGIDPNIEVHIQKSVCLPVFVFAMERGSKKSIKLFIDKGVNVTTEFWTDKGMATYHHLLAARRDTDILKWFVDKNINLEVSNFLGFSEAPTHANNFMISNIFWHLYALDGNKESIQVILSKKIDVMAKTTQRFTIFELLQPHQNKKVLRYYERLDLALKEMLFGVLVSGETIPTIAIETWQYMIQIVEGFKSQNRDELSTIFATIVSNPALEEYSDYFDKIFSNQQLLGEISSRVEENYEFYKELDRQIRNIHRIQAGITSEDKEILEMLNAYASQK